MYGFLRLVRKGPGQKAYYHEKFLRGHASLISKMRRNDYAVHNVRKTFDPDTEPDFNSLPWLHEFGPHGINRTEHSSAVVRDQTAPKLHAELIPQRADVAVAPLPFHALTGFVYGNEVLNHAALSAFMRDAFSPYLHLSANPLPLEARSGQLTALQPAPIAIPGSLERAPLAVPGSLEPAPLSVPGSLLSMGLAPQDIVSAPPSIKGARQALGDTVVFREATTSSSSLVTDSERLRYQAMSKVEAAPGMDTRASSTKRRRKTGPKVENSVKSTTSFNEGKAMIPYPSKCVV
jgi:hypothetical protein